jgi:RNA-splicing ligase RtcB
MTSEGQRLKKIRETELKRRDRLTLKRLAERIKRARADRSHAHKQIAHYCRLGRQNISARVRALRAEAREALNLKAEKLRTAQREQCKADQRAARQDFDRELAALAAELEQDRRSFAHHYGRKTSRTTAAERRAESDDEVERNLPPELVSVFRAVKATIRARPKMSRTEAFLHWVEENPDAVHSVMYDQAERDTARLIAEHERVAKRLRKGKRAYEDPHELAHALAGVPF